MISVNNEIESTLKSGVREGYFTDYFVELGSLNDNTVFYRCGDDSVIFDLASLTKALVLSPLVFTECKARNISLHTPIGQFIKFPVRVLSMNRLDNITFFDLLSHSSGLGAWTNFWANRLIPEANSANLFRSRHLQIEEVLSRRDLFQNKYSELYSDIGFILLGYIFENLVSDSLENYFYKCLDGSLSSKMGGPRFLQRASKENIASTGYCPIRDRIITGEVHDENCAALGGFSGHAGLFSSGEGLSQFFRCISPLPNWRMFLEENFKQQELHSKSGLLGLRRGDDESSQCFGNGSSIGHLGFTGTAFWIDMKRDTYAIFLTNRVVSGRRSAEIKMIRRSIFSYLNSIKI